MAEVTLTGVIGEPSETTPRRVTLWETFTYEKNQALLEGKRKWTIWFMDAGHGLVKDDWVELRGSLSTKVFDWTAQDGTAKQLVDHIVNGPEIVQHKRKNTDEPAPVVRDLDDERKYGSAPF
jgi:hypothetical protein